MGADGNWNIVMNTPMGAQPATLELATAGSALTGKLNSAMIGTLELEDGAANGDELEWKASMTSPMAMTLNFTAKVDGDAISGNVALGGMGDASFSGTRA